MGDAAFVRNQANPQAGQKPHSLRLHFDVPLLITVACLIVIGLLMVYSSSWNYSIRKFQVPSYLLQRQLIWVGVGLVVALVISLINYRVLLRLGLPMMAVTLFLLFIVLWVNDGSGPSRTLLGGSVQPSELAKIVMVIYLSVWLNSKKEQISDIFFGLFPMMSILGITGGLILLEPDISAAGTIVILGLIMFFLSGGELRQLVLVFLVVIILGALVVSISHTGQQRIGDYIAGLVNPEQASYHVQRAMEAVVRGGLFGVGIGKGITKFTGLPVPWTDSIFAVIAEETGLLGAALVIVLYVVLLWRGMTIASKAPDFFGKILASGMSMWIVLEAIINIGVMVNLVPFAGNALPFVSFGGSNMVTSLVAVGILMSISRATADQQSDPEGRSYSAAINLRWRNGRRSVSRASRYASPRR